MENREEKTEQGCRAGLKVNFLVHLQSLASKIFSTSKLVRIRTASSKFLGDMDDSNLQTFASGYFSHSQIINITHIFASLQVLISSPGGGKRCILICTDCL